MGWDVKEFGEPNDLSQGHEAKMTQVYRCTCKVHVYTAEYRRILWEVVLADHLETFFPQDPQRSITGSTR